MTIEMKVKTENFKPEKAHESDAGFDVRANEDCVIPSNSTLAVPCGFSMAIPNGYVAVVCSRSGMALKHNVFVLNSAGIIDAGYRGEVKVILHNIGSEDFEIKKGDKVAQLVILKLADVQVTEVENLDESDRGDNGFGSTGK